jgi:hypothetical protein
VVGRNVNVHHGDTSDSFAIRDGRLVTVREDSSGFEGELPAAALSAMERVKR